MLYVYPLLLSLFTLTLTHALPTSPQPSAAASRPYSNHTFLAAHNSPFIGPLPQHNQNLNITEQLSLGIRFLQGQTHRSPTNESQLQLCHTSCALEDGGPLVQFLETVRGWLQENPGEVVSILLTNGDRVGVEMFGEAFRESGIEEMVFVPETGDSGAAVLPIEKWPSVEEMVGMGKRVVVFLGMYPQYPILSHVMSCPNADYNQTTAPTHPQPPTSSTNSPTSSKPPSAKQTPPSQTAASTDPPAPPRTAACTS